jgi:transposase
MSTAAVFIGIDVAKGELVTATPTSELCRGGNDPAGIRKLVAHLRTLVVDRVTLESTGCYGRAVTAALIAAGYQVAVVQPGRVRHFAASIGVRAKTDPIDAKVIARFAQATQPRPLTPPSEAVLRLRALVDRRDQVLDMRIQDENRLETIADPLIAREVRANIARLRRIEERYAQQIAAAIEADEGLRAVGDRLQEESGVGLHTTAVLLAHCPELGQLNRQRAAALAGLAPYDRSSGTSERKRTIYGGRQRLRRALYLAAISAVRWNPTLKDLYANLRARGKPAKVALIACARKLLVRLNSLAAAVLQPNHERQVHA